MARHELPDGVTPEDFEVFVNVCNAFLGEGRCVSMQGYFTVKDTQTGETREVHFSLHDSLFCQMTHLEHLDNQVGDHQ